MDTFSPKTRAGLSFAEWQSLSPAAAAREVHARVAALPPALRSAAIAWLAPAEQLAAGLAATGADARPPLHGLPYFLKDLFDLAEAPTRAGSSFLAEVRPGPHADCAMVRWMRSAGAAVAGKSHLVEFASGLTGENIHYGDCPHPAFPDRLAGGSSSGSAALVAAGVVPLAVGTDTGGSVRVPAAFCGLHGLRLTPGEPLIRDAFPLSSSCDTVGWFTATATDLNILLGVLDGAAQGEVRPLRGCHLRLADLVAVHDSDTAAACDRAAANLCPHADDTTRQQLRADWQDALATYSTLTMREAFAVHREWMAPQRDRYNPAIWSRYREAGDWPEERIEQAHRAKEAIRQGWERFFESYDYVVLPATATPAPRKSDCTLEFRLNLLALTAPASVGGFPVLTIPVPLRSGLSSGLQVVARTVSSGVFARILDRQ